MHPFIVPIQENQGKLSLNWKLVDNVIEYIRAKINDVLYLQKPRTSIHQALGVEKLIKPIDGLQDSQFAKKQDLVGVWDDKFTGVRYVKLEKFFAAQRWDEPILHLENRTNLQSNDPGPQNS